VLGFRRADKGPLDCVPLIEHIELADGSVQNRTRTAGCYPTRGGFPLVVVGASFGKATGIVYIGTRPCFVASWSHSTIVCTSPQGYGDAIPVTVKVGNRISDNSTGVLFEYDSPLVDTFMPNVPDAAGQLVTIKGSNFGFEQTPLEVIVGGIPCQTSEWLNDNTLTCVTAPDVVGTKNVSILVAGRSKPFVWYDVEAKVVFECAKDWYGLAGEVCLDCSKTLQGCNLSWL
jgi:hypothetical protein